MSVVVKATTGASQYSHDAVLRRHDLLVEQLPEIAVRLEYPRPLPPLHALLELKNNALKQRGEQQRREHLRNLQDYIPHDHRPILETRRVAAGVDIGSGDSEDRSSKAQSPVCQNWPDRSHQPRGRLKGELHRRHGKLD